MRQALAQQVRVATYRFALVGPLARMELVATWRSRPATMYLCEVAWVLVVPVVVAQCEWSVAVLAQAPVVVLLLLRATAIMTVVR